MKLVIAEKPAIASAIAEVLPGKAQRYPEYTVKGEYTLTSAFGHLLTLKEPEDYDEKYRKWSLEDLPIDFPHWEKKPKEATEKRLQAIGALLQQADSVIHAGDCDEEGQLLIDEILDYYHYTGPVQRLNTQSLLPEALRQALGRMDNNALHRLDGQAANARMVADFLVGINYSRFYTLQNGTTLSVGRVQTPTLGLVVARDLAIEQHKKAKYYELHFDAELEGYPVVLQYHPGKQDIHAEDGKVKDKAYLEEVLHGLRGTRQTLKVTQTDEKEAPPLPFNLVKLQTYAGRYGYSPSETLKITQNLREKYKAITYNRSDCQYLSNAHFAQGPAVTEHVLANLGMDMPEGLDCSRKSRCFDDAKITAHHAIIPEPIDLRESFSSFSDGEKKIYQAICLYYLAQFLPPAQKHRTKLRAELEDGADVQCSFLEISDPGYRLLLKDSGTEKQEGEEKEKAFPVPLTEPEYQVDLQDGEILERETKPLPRYTKTSLNEDMTRISKYVEDPEIKRILLEKDKDKKGENGSIGTSATRSAIIDTLEKRGYIVPYKGKQIISTPLAREFYALLPDPIKKADLTARWWTVQEEIKEGKASQEDLLAMVQRDIADIFAQEPKKVSANHIQNSREKETIGACPFCGKPVYESAKSFYCSGYKEGCKFSLFKDRFLGSLGKSMTKATAKALLKNKKALVKGMKGKSGKSFDAYVCVEFAQPYPKYSLEFLPKGKG